MDVQQAAELAGHPVRRQLGLDVEIHDSIEVLGQCHVRREDAGVVSGQPQLPLVAHATGSRELRQPLDASTGQTAPARPSLGDEWKRDVQGRAVGQREEERGLGQAGLAAERLGKRVARLPAEHGRGRITLAEGGAGGS